MVEAKEMVGKCFRLSYSKELKPSFYFKIKKYDKRLNRFIVDGFIFNLKSDMNIPYLEMEANKLIRKDIPKDVTFYKHMEEIKPKVYKELYSRLLSFMN